MDKQGWENNRIGQSTFSDIIGNNCFISRMDVGIAGAGHYFFTMNCLKVVQCLVAIIK